LSACESNEKNCGTALEMYSTDFGGRYPASMSLLTPKYLKVIPTCPAASSDTYSSSYVVASGPDAYTFVCRGSNHSDLLNGSSSFPQYNSAQGLVSGH
jgi:hypothetical protein